MFIYIVMYFIYRKLKAIYFISYVNVGMKEFYNQMKLINVNIIYVFYLKWQIFYCVIVEKCVEVWIIYIKQEFEELGKCCCDLLGNLD